MRAKRNVVRDSIIASQASIACIEEPKLSVIDAPIVVETLGHSSMGFLIFLCPSPQEVLC